MPTIFLSRVTCKGLMVSHDELMNRFAHRRILSHVFALAGRVHKLFDVFLSRFAADIRQGVGKEMIILQHCRGNPFLRF